MRSPGLRIGRGSNEGWSHSALCVAIRASQAQIRDYEQCNVAQHAVELGSGPTSSRSRAPKKVSTIAKDRGENRTPIFVSGEAASVEFMARPPSSSVQSEDADAPPLRRLRLMGRN